ncbi:hypothetical protein AQUCO_00100536v1 [Aquilegia coerulea]|uniref:TF-B3 domain-containing protein n=1 Tax=Aquilegia coerulea TaxID=218851 RepID=A0A2G5FB08_AQUCA|nr:hypothetical protein AQUCO_00100536v1 [Aquilegia coerulea]
MVRIRKNKLHNINNNNNNNNNVFEEIPKQESLDEINKEELPVEKPELKIGNTIDDLVEVRRSSRARKLICFDSEEIDTEFSRPLKRLKSSSWQRYSARPLNEIKFASDEERAYAIQCAENFQRNLLSGYPCFIKSMVRTQVYSCFWLGIPTEFCQNHLPSDDVTIVLEDEDGLEYNSVYLADRKGLSGGWRAFALAHKLDDGDALVFELTEPRRLEIYIFKAFELHTRKVVKNSDKKANSDKTTSKNRETKDTKNSNKKAAKLNQDENSAVENDYPSTSSKAHTGGDGLKTAASRSNEGISVLEEALQSYEDSEGSVSSMVPREGLCKGERDQTSCRITATGGWKRTDFCCNEQTFESREDGKSCEGGGSSVSPLVQLSDDLWFGKKEIRTKFFRRKRT